MKRKSMVLALALALGLTSFQGCIGTFGLTGKVYNFNKGLGDKWIQEIGFLVLIIVPIYEIAVIVDAIVFNSIQFWTGSNPVAMQPGEKEIQYVKSDKALYKIEATQNRFHIVQIDGPKAGESADLVYDPKTKTWLAGVGQHMRKIAQFEDNSPRARVFKPNGEVVTVRTDSTPDEIYKALGLSM